MTITLLVGLRIDDHWVGAGSRAHEAHIDTIVDQVLQEASQQHGTLLPPVHCVAVTAGPGTNPRPLRLDPLGVLMTSHGIRIEALPGRGTEESATDRRGLECASAAHSPFRSACVGASIAFSVIVGGISIPLVAGQWRPYPTHRVPRGGPLSDTRGR